MTLTSTSTGEECATLDETLSSIVAWEVENGESVANQLAIGLVAQQTQPLADSVHSHQRNSLRISVDALVQPQAPMTATISQTVSSNGQFGRGKRKEELMYLREKVRELELKLVQTKQFAQSSIKMRSSGPNEGNEDEACGDRYGSDPEQPPSTAASMWEEIASRQYERRQQVALENTKLKAELENQIRLAKSLEKILSKRTNIDLFESSLGQKRYKRDILQPVNTDNQMLYDQMLSEMDGLYTCTDRIFESKIFDLTKGAFRESQVKHDSAKGIYMEFAQRHILPFNVEVCQNALWRFMGEKGIKADAYYHEEIEWTKDNILRSYGVELYKRNREINLRGRQVMHRYMEENRVVTVWKVLLEPLEFSGGPSKGMVFWETGWSVITPVESDPISSSPSADPQTKILSYVTITPSISENATHQNWKVGALTDFVIISRNDMIEANAQVLENLFLEEATKLQMERGG